MYLKNKIHTLLHLSKFANGYVFLNYLTSSPREKMHFACTIMVFYQKRMEIFVYLKKLPKIAKKLKILDIFLQYLHWSSGSIKWMIVLDFQYICIFWGEIQCMTPENHIFTHFSSKNPLFWANAHKPNAGMPTYDQEEPEVLAWSDRHTYYLK